MKDRHIAKKGNIELKVSNTKEGKKFFINKDNKRIWETKVIKKVTMDEYNKVAVRYNAFLKESQAPSVPKPTALPASGYKWVFDSESNVWNQVPQETETLEIKQMLSKRDIKVKAMDFKNASDVEWDAFMKTYVEQFKRIQEKIQGLNTEDAWPYAQESFEELIELVLPEDAQTDSSVIERIKASYERLGHDVEMTERLKDITQVQMQEDMIDIEKEVDVAKRDIRHMEQEGKTMEQELQEAIDTEDYIKAQEIKDQMDALTKMIETKKKPLCKKDANWPSIDRATEWGLKPRFYAHPAGTYPGRDPIDSPLSGSHMLMEVANKFGAEYSQGIEDMMKLTSRGYGIDKAIAHAIERNDNLEDKDDVKKKLTSIYYQYVKGLGK